MSVLIRDMKKPKNCCFMIDGESELCPFVNTDDDCVLLLGGNCYGTWEEQYADCPLVELPEKHGRLIDADAVMKQWGLDKATKYGNETSEQQHFSYSTMMMYEIADVLDDAPVVIEAEGEQ